MFKDFVTSQDVSNQTSIVNEIISLTGSIFSSSFYTKNFVNITSGSAVSGGFWVSVYDGAPTSVSASSLVDFTFGISVSSSLSSYSETFLKSEKQRTYKLMAQRLLGNKSSLFTFNNITYNDLFFISLKRRLYKDELKKGNLSITLQVSGGVGDVLTLTDTGAQTTYDTGVGGDEGDLLSGSTPVGKVYYNAGIIVFHTGVFVPVGGTESIYWSGSTANKMNLNQSPISGNIDNVIYGFQNRINQITAYNQTNLHSLIYFCRALNNEFNYSSNPTFIDSEGRILPTSGSDLQTRSYITKIGLYDSNNNLLAVANLSSPVKKSPDSELVVRTRISW